MLYEHVRPHNPFPGKLTDLVSPLIRRLFGPSSTVYECNVETAGLNITAARRRGIWREQNRWRVVRAWAL